MLKGVIDIDHFEKNGIIIFNKLFLLNYSGIILLNDVFNHPDRITKEYMLRFWNSINIEKYDLTKYGHYTGTGIVIINYPCNIILS
jgi:hypothetical protein